MVEIEGERSTENLPSAFGLSNNMELRGIQQPQQQEAELTAYLEPSDYPESQSWEVPRGSIFIEKVIGQGAFGQVAKGTALQLRGVEGTTTVAIKMLKGNL